MIKAQAQNVARNLADTPANLMTPKIFAQVSFMATYSYIGASFNTVLRFRQVCLCIYMPCFLFYNVLLPIMPPHPTIWTGNVQLYFFYSILAFSCFSSLLSFVSQETAPHFMSVRPTAQTVNFSTGV